MNNKKNLILIPFKNLSKLKLKNSIFLGDWCRRYNSFEKIQSEPYHWSDYNKIEKFVCLSLKLFQNFKIN